MTIDPRAIVGSFRAAGVRFFTGVPDTLLKGFGSAIAEASVPENHLVAANEGTATAIAAGHYLATGQPALVYMQNAGLGNAVNPIVSLASPEVYGIPMILLVGWRGEPGGVDAPQHVHQGRITPDFLSLLDIPTFLLDSEASLSVIDEAVSTAMDRMCPVAVLVRSQTIAPQDADALLSDDSWSEMTRRDALRVILDHIDDETVVVSTTGYISRELASIRSDMGDQGRLDFMSVGSMGHASSIALGIAVARSGRLVICLDGDGSMVMHMGALASIGAAAPANLGHIVLNNRVHESVGGQASSLAHANVTAVADACGYSGSSVARTSAELASSVGQRVLGPGPWMIEARIRRGSTESSERPTALRLRMQTLRDAI